MWTPAAWNPPFLHPAANVLAYSDHLYGLAVLAWPAVAAGVPATAIVNGVAWCAFFLTSVALFYWLADRLAFTQGLERELFPGIGFIVLVAIGTVSAAVSRGASRTTVLIGLVVSAVALWASTGPAADGGSTLLHLPYELLTAIVPGARNVRVPARFVILAAIFLAPAIAEGWHRVFDRLVVTFSSRGIGAALGVGLLLLVVVEGLPGLTTYDTVTFTTIQTLPATVPARGLLFLPLGDPRDEIRRMWLARRHGVPVVNGYSGHPSSLWEAIWHLQAGALTHDVRQMVYSRLLDSGVDTIVLAEPDSPLIDRQTLEPISDRAFRIRADLKARDVRTMPLGRGAGLLIPELGWSYPEQGNRESWVWSLDRRAVIAVPMDGGPAQQMSPRVRSLSPGGTATLGLWWNGRLLGSEPLRGDPGVVTFTLPEAATRAGWTRFELDGPVPVRPNASTDPRRLSVCLFEVVVR